MLISTKFKALCKKIMNGETSIKKAKEQQDELWNWIYELKKRTSKKREAKSLLPKVRTLFLI